MKEDEDLSSNENPKEEKPRKLIRFDFPPGATPEEVAKAIQELRQKALAEKK